MCDLVVNIEHSHASHASSLQGWELQTTLDCNRNPRIKGMVYSIKCPNCPVPPRLTSCPILYSSGKILLGIVLNVVHGRLCHARFAIGKVLSPAKRIECLLNHCIIWSVHCGPEVNWAVLKIIGYF